MWMNLVVGGSENVKPGMVRIPGCFGEKLVVSVFYDSVLHSVFETSPWSLGEFFKQRNTLSTEIY